MADINANPDAQQTPVFNATEIYGMGDPPPVNIRAAGARTFHASNIYGPGDPAPGENLFNFGLSSASSTPPTQTAASPVSASASTNIFDQGFASSPAATPTQTPAPSFPAATQSNA